MRRRLTEPAEQPRHHPRLHQPGAPPNTVGMIAWVKHGAHRSACAKRWLPLPWPSAGWLSALHAMCAQELHSEEQRTAPCSHGEAATRNPMCGRRLRGGGPVTNLLSVPRLGLVAHLGHTGNTRASPLVSSGRVAKLAFEIATLPPGRACLSECQTGDARVHHMCCDPCRATCLRLLAGDAPLTLCPVIG